MALTVVILAFLPAARTSKLFTRKTVGQPRPKGFDVITSLTTLAVLSALVMVGLVCGWLAERDGRLGRAVWAHVGFNATVIVIMLAG